MEQIYDVIMGVFCDDFCKYRESCRSSEDDVCPVDDAIRKAVIEHLTEK